MVKDMVKKTGKDMGLKICKHEVTKFSMQMFDIRAWRASWRRSGRKRGEREKGGKRVVHGVPYAVQSQ